MRSHLLKGPPSTPRAAVLREPPPPEQEGRCSGSIAGGRLSRRLPPSPQTCSLFPAEPGESLPAQISKLLGVFNSKNPPSL